MNPEAVNTWHSTTPTPRVISYRPINSGALVASVDIAFPGGWILRELPYFVKPGSTWVQPPSVVYEGRGGMKKRRYLLDFASQDARLAFQQYVLAAIDAFLATAR